LDEAFGLFLLKNCKGSLHSSRNQSGDRENKKIQAQKLKRKNYQEGNSDKQFRIMIYGCGSSNSSGRNQTHLSHTFILTSTSIVARYLQKPTAIPKRNASIVMSAQTPWNWQ